MLLKHKTCLITGAAQGIGRSIAEHFAIEGAEVYALDIHLDKLKEWTSTFTNNALGTITPLELDVTDSKMIKSVIQSIYKSSGKIDVLVNNAGLIYNRKIGMIPEDETQKMFELNVLAVINLIQLTSRIMERNHSGSIINIASVTATLGSPGQVAYSSSKGAIISLTKSAAKELAPKGIRVNAVAPGIIQTERFAELYSENEDKINARVKQIGLGRLGKPEDVAYACSFLASDRASYISGQILGVDGCAII